MLRIIACLALAALWLLTGIGAAKAEDPSFKVATSEAALNGKLVIQAFDGNGVIDPDKVKLLLNGSPLGVVPDVEPMLGGAGHTLTFILSRGANNRALWSELLGAPFGRPKSMDVAVAVEIGDRQLAPALGTTQKFTLLRYHGGWMTLAVFLLAIFIAVTIWLCLNSTIARDGDNGLVPVQKSLRPYSLGRVQMAVWSVLIVSSFVFIFIVTFGMDSINSESFILLGISSATALGSVAVNQISIPALPAAQQAQLTAATTRLKTLNLETAADVDRLYEEYKPIKNVRNKNQDEKSIADRWHDYLEAIKPYRSAGFADLICDANGPTIHRWQAVIWTVVLAGIYAANTYLALETPTFGTNLLTLMGITSGTYLGFKIKEAS